MICKRDLSIALNRALGGSRGCTLSGRLYWASVYNLGWRRTAAELAVRTINAAFRCVTGERDHCRANFIYDKRNPNG